MYEKDIEKVEVGEYLQNPGRGGIHRLAKVTRLTKTVLIAELDNSGQEVRVSRRNGKQHGTSGWQAQWWYHCDDEAKVRENNLAIRRAAEERKRASAEIESATAARVQEANEGVAATAQPLEAGLYKVNLVDSTGASYVAIFASAKEKSWAYGEGAVEIVALTPQVWKSDRYGEARWSNPGRVEGRDLREAVMNLARLYW